MPQDVIDLKQEFHQAKERIRVHTFIAKAIKEAERVCNTKKMKLHRETFVKYLCDDQNIDIDEYKETIQFITEYIIDHPDKFKYSPKE